MFQQERPKQHRDKPDDDRNEHDKNTNTHINYNTTGLLRVVTHVRPLPWGPPPDAVPYALFQELKEQQITHAATRSALARGDAAAAAASLFTFFNLHVFKENRSHGTVSLTQQPALVLGKEGHGVCDVVLEHPTCSALHAVLCYRLVEQHASFSSSSSSSSSESDESDGSDDDDDLGGLRKKQAPTSSSRTNDKRPRSHNQQHNSDNKVAAKKAAKEQRHRIKEEARKRRQRLKEQQRSSLSRSGTTKELELHLLDLGSTNGSFVGSLRCEPFRYYRLDENEVLSFGQSSRKYVVMAAMLR